MLYKNKKKVIVAISGGVDSSVAAWLLKKQGYQVEGVFIKSWEEDDNKKYCNSAKDLNDAQNVCDSLDIKLHTINFSLEYWDKVFTKILIEYKKGYTPNPDILCNKEIKFKAFLEFANENLGADFISTGHYVRSLERNGKQVLLRSIDKNKDQSYFLYTLSHNKLKQCLFPIGELINKSKVRSIATNLGLITANKKDSTGICFIGKRKFSSFISKYLPKNPGKILSTDGYILGYHQGLIYYTLGQRKGIGIGGISSKKSNPWYVVDKNIKKNYLIVTQNIANSKLMSNKFIISNIYWVQRKSIIEKLKCTVKTRYRQLDVECVIIPASNKLLHVHLKKPMFSITPGQSAVFYSGDNCLGGGIIEIHKTC